jgi:hypothetical protein
MPHRQLIEEPLGEWKPRATHQWSSRWHATRTAALHLANKESIMHDTCDTWERYRQKEDKKQRTQKKHIVG